MKLPVMLLAFALAPAAQLAAQEPQPEPPAQEEPAAPQETVSATPAAGGDVQSHIDAGLSAFRKRRFAAARAALRAGRGGRPRQRRRAPSTSATRSTRSPSPSGPSTRTRQRAAELFAKAYELDPTFKPAWSKRG